MRSFIFTVKAEGSGERLDKLLVSQCPEAVSRTFVKMLIDSGLVTVSGIVAKANRKMKEGERVEVAGFEKPPQELRSEDIPLDIVYEDEHLIVINKPSGMVVHPGAGNHSGTLVNALLHHCAGLSAIGGPLRPGIVHRLDKGTSGLVVVAKNDRTHGALARQFKKRKVKKVYIGFVKGVVELNHGTIDAPIARSRFDRKKMGVQFVESKPAVTRYEVVKRFKDFTVLKMHPDTGRTHQIRVHLSYIGHPILGDDTYGKTDHDIRRIALHAKTIGFIHPITKQPVEFDSELPDDLKEFLKRHETKGH